MAVGHVVGFVMHYGVFLCIMHPFTDLSFALLSLFKRI
jgi:hypothetical protein